MLDIYEMEIFLAAAETGSFSEAARRLQMSQPAVSMQIRTLEKRLGTELFHRSGRHIRLTEVGQALIPMARGLVNHAIHIHEAVASLQGEVVGHLKVSCSTTAGKYILPKLMAGFLELYPAVQLSCNVLPRGSALESLLDGDAHLAVTSMREPSRELEFRPFTTDPVVLIAAPDHAWAKRKTINIEELQAGRFIRREINSGTQQTVIQALAEHNISMDDLTTVIILSNSEAIHIAVAEGIGVAFVSYRAAAEGIANGRVVEIEIENLKMVQQLYMVRHTQREPTTVQTAFWEYVYSPANRHILESLPI